VAERCRFRAYLVYSLALTGFIYPVVSHWIWSPQGFLYGKVMDFSGSGAVHLVGGSAAMAGALWLGPRIGKFRHDKATGTWETRDIPGHNAVLAALGTFILWTGFFAFNGAACGAFFCPDISTTGRVVVVTMLAGSSGCMTLLFYGSIVHKCWDMKLAMNGLLAGMVACCSGCNVFDPFAGVIVGACGAFSYHGQSYLWEYVFHIDDPVGAAPLHMGAGVLGMIAVGFLANKDFVESQDQTGIFYGGTGKQLGWQILASLIYFAWAFGTCSIVFGALRYFGMLRVSEEVERMGMDTHHHGGDAYPNHRDSMLYIASSVIDNNKHMINDPSEALEVLETAESTAVPSTVNDSPLTHRRSHRNMSIREGAA
jgi:ammonium transporter, Amt family